MIWALHSSFYDVLDYRGSRNNLNPWIMQLITIAPRSKVPKNSCPLRKKYTYKSKNKQFQTLKKQFHNWFRVILPLCPLYRVFLKYCAKVHCIWALVAKVVQCKMYSKVSVWFSQKYFCHYWHLLLGITSYFIHGFWSL